MIFNLRENLFRLWYWYVNKVDKNAEILFMNFGYDDDKVQVQLDEKNEANRYSIQLYHHLAVEIDLKNKDMVEIGCGRGGGLAYIAETFSPKTALGVDLNQQAADFCNRFYKHNGLSFQQGDAQNLKLEDNAYDVVMNVESSHRYPDMKAFLGEVKRILRSDGHFLFTDFRYDYEMDELKQQLAKTGMTILMEKEINNEVVKALEKDDKRRRDLVVKLTPKFIHKTALNFAGTIGSETYEQFKSRKYVYFSYVMQK